jgi:hypothetical protein
MDGWGYGSVVSTVILTNEVEYAGLIPLRTWLTNRGVEPQEDYPEDSVIILSFKAPKSFRDRTTGVVSDYWTVHGLVEDYDKGLVRFSPICGSRDSGPPRVALDLSSTALLVGELESEGA